MQFKKEQKFWYGYTIHINPDTFMGSLLRYKSNARNKIFM
jgi:hypothetical protein